ncbi:MAG: hypothetical protein ACI4JE_04775 [Ruminococcus sp.]|nr:hypothetical protein [Oscillospiraceae bacterium]
MTDAKIYSDIFDIVSENYKKTGGSFGVSKTAYLHLAADNPSDVDVYELSKENDNRVFLEKCYMSFLKRLADERAFESWTPRFELPKSEYQRLLVITMIGSAEYDRAQIRAYNNIYSQKNVYGGKLETISATTGMTMPDKLLKLYRKQPEFLKKIERKIAGIKN